MDVVIAGGHGQIALRLARLLAARGDRARSIVRNPGHVDDVADAGADAVVFDLEERSAEELADVVAGADAVVFAAGAGPGSGAERKQTMDLGGAVKLIEACKATGVMRYLMVSSIGAGDPSAASGSMLPYLEAKAAADRALVESGLGYTICRPGSLTDDPGTDMVAIAEHLGRRGAVPRDDVAATLFACLGRENTIGKTFELLSGPTPIDQALAGL
jgi:uncharacterized protein YbjT (DUF2867 family)